MRLVLASLHGLGQSSPHDLALGVELGSRSISFNALISYDSLFPYSPSDHLSQLYPANVL